MVQGGTFLNDAILRSFEQEIGRDVTRPAISGLMGAYGAALHAKDNRPAKTTLIGMDVLSHFRHTVKSARCGLCENHCSLTVNDFRRRAAVHLGQPLRTAARRHKEGRAAQPV